MDDVVSETLAVGHENMRVVTLVILGLSYLHYLSIVDVLTRFTNVRVSAKYHGIKLEYQELRHTVLDLLWQIGNKLRFWKRPYVSPEAIRVLLREWHVGGPASDLTSLEKFMRFVVTDTFVRTKECSFYFILFLKTGTGEHTRATNCIRSNAPQAEAGF